MNIVCATLVLLVLLGCESEIYQIVGVILHINFPPSTPVSLKQFCSNEIMQFYQLRLSPFAVKTLMQMFNLGFMFTDVCKCNVCRQCASTGPVPVSSAWHRTFFCVCHEFAEFFALLRHLVKVGRHFVIFGWLFGLNTDFLVTSDGQSRD